MRAGEASFGWMRIARLGLVQSALGAVVVLATSTLNRVMVVEYALPASLPGALVAFHYAVQFLRPRLGHGADASGHLTRWILGGMATLAAGGTLAAVAVAVMADHGTAGLVLALLAYALIGLGVGAAGTSLLVLLSKVVPGERRAGAATLVWIMMIAGFAITSGIASHFLEPYSPERLVLVTASACLLAFVIAATAVAGLDRVVAPEARANATLPFRQTLRTVWTEPATRRFTMFIFVSMMAYSAEELLLEPFAGLVMHLSVSGSTRLSGTLHAGSVLGMASVALLGARWLKGRGPSLRSLIVAGCLASAALLAVLGGLASRPGWPLAGTVWMLGFANGLFAVAAIGMMMQLGAARDDGRGGIRMGLWGAAQAVAFAIGGISATLLVDLIRRFLGQPLGAYGAVFLCEAALFVGAALLASRFETDAKRRSRARSPATPLATLDTP
jgi:BCD family chlorophyll transporter-like MFS transporter